MIDLDQTLSKYLTDIHDVDSWAEDQYSKLFKEYFKDVDIMYSRLKSNDNPITDDELEQILTRVPLELINVSEKLSYVRNMQEVIKLGIKNRESEELALLLESGTGITKAKEEAAQSVIQDKLLLSVYDSIYDRVTRQTTFAKELIMSSKKIWDARRNSEQSMPSISAENINALPDYYPAQRPSTYIG